MIVRRAESSAFYQSLEIEGERPVVRSGALPVAITVLAGILALPDAARLPRTHWRGPSGAEPREDVLNPLGLADLRALAASILLYYGTGLPLARWLARGAGGPVLAWALPCSLTVLMGGLFVARLVGLDLSGATGVIAFVVLAAVVIPTVRGGDSGRAGAAGVSEAVRPVEWGLIGALVLVLLAAGGPLGMVTDTFSHLAAIRRSLLGDAILPTDVFYRGGDGIGWDPRNGFLHPLHAFVCRLAQVDPLNLWRVLPAVFAPGVLLAISRFLRVWTGPGRRGDVSLLLWVLVGSGSGLLWLVRTGYPNHVAYPLSFLALAVAMEYLLHPGPDGAPARGPGLAGPCSCGRRIPLVAIGMLAFAGALIHLVASLLLLVGLGFLGAAALLDRADIGPRFGKGEPGARLRRVGVVAAAAVAGMAAPLAFRLLTQGRVESTLHTHQQGLFFLGHGLLLASPVAVLRQVGFAGLLALLVLPFAVQVVPRRRRLTLVFFTVGPWVCVWTPLFTPLYGVLGYLVTRLLELVPVGAVLVLAVEGVAQRWSEYRAAGQSGRMGPVSGNRGRGPLNMAVAGIAAGLVLFAAGRAILRQPRQFRETVLDARMDVSFPASSGAFAFIRGVVNASPSRPPVVLADPFTSYALGGLTGAQFVTTLNQHGPPIDRHWRDRLDDQREMLLGTADPARNDSLLAAYQVDLVFVNSALWTPVADFGIRIESPAMERARRHLEDAPAAFPVFYRGADGIVTGVRPNGGAAGAAGAEGGNRALPADSVGGTVVVNAGPFAFGSISAVDVALPAHPVARGEWLRIPLSWVRTGTVASDLPLIAYLRVSTAVPSRWYVRPAWSKLARHLAQRSDDRLYRIRIGRPPFDGERDPARLPLHEPMADRLLVFMPPAAAPGDYEVTLSLVEDALTPNLWLRDLWRDDDSVEGLVVGRFTLQ